MPDPSSSALSTRQRLRQLAERGATKTATLSTDEIAALCKWLISIDDEETDAILKRRWIISDEG